MASVENTKMVLLAGRLNGPKGEVALAIIENVFAKILQSGADAIFVIAGGPVLPAHRELATRHKGLQFIGFRDDIAELYRTADVVVGAGRVAFEAMAAARPVLAIGHHCYCGPALKANEQRIIETNAGDFAQERKYAYERLLSDLLRLLADAPFRNKVAQQGQDIARKFYNTARIAREVEDKYQRAILSANAQRFAEIRISLDEKDIQADETAILASDLDKKRLAENPVFLIALNVQKGCLSPYILFLNRESMLRAEKNVHSPGMDIGLICESFADVQSQVEKIKSSLKGLTGQARVPVLLEKASENDIRALTENGFFPVLVRKKNAKGNDEFRIAEPD